MTAPSAHATYAIHVEGVLSPATWSTWFGSISVSSVEGGVTRLAGTFDQAALHGLLGKIRNLGLVIVSVRRLDDVAVPPV